MKPREQELEKIIIDTIWMARRYADGRKTYAVSMLNDAIDHCDRLGIAIQDDHTLINSGKYATDGHKTDSWKVKKGGNNETA